MSRPARRVTGRAVAASVAAAATVLASLAVPGGQSAAAPAAPVRMIVELAAPPALASLADPEAPAARAARQAVERAGALQQQHQALVDEARDQGVELSLVHDLTAAYNGLVVEVTPDQAAELAELPGVRAVHPDTSYSVALEHSVPLVGAPEVWQLTDPSGKRVTGTGVTVAIVDTGVDYRHPDLGGGFGEGHKVVAGYDFVNDDPDPLDDNGHGTHVAGIVAADGEVKGVAPDARLTAYKVLGRSGNGDVSDILAGLDAAVDPANPYRADVVNMSLSGPGDGTDPLSVAAEQAVAAGVVVVGAAGNAGPNPQTVRSPAAADGVLAVGATASGVRVPRVEMVAPVVRDLRAARFEISADPPAEPTRLEVVDVGQGRPEDYEGVDVEGKAVLIDQAWPAPELAVLAEQRGAAAALLYFPDFWGGLPNAASTPGNPAAEPAPTDAFAAGLDDDGRLDRLVLLQIPGASATVIHKHLAEGPVTLELTAEDATDLLADFSSRGPSGAFTAKPDLVAPGVEVLSTLPEGGYGRGSGTSMAAPHVAAGAALLRQLHPDWTPEQVGAALSGSARRLPGLDPSEQGAGRLDLPAATATTVLANPNNISFGLAGAADEQIERSRTLTLTNHGSEPARLTMVVHEHTGGGTITVDPAHAELAPGAAIEVTVRATLPTPASDQDINGWLSVLVAGERALSVPYLLAVRHLGVHVTPDPAPAGTETNLYVRSPAELAGPPRLSVDCPGQPPVQVTGEPAGTQIWRATVPVGAAGVCQVRATAPADGQYGEPELTLTGEVGFESAAAPGPGRGTSQWQSVGPNAEAGWLAFSARSHRVAVVPTSSPSIFVSDDRMQTWREVRTMPMAGGAPADVEVHPHPRFRDTMFVAVNGGSADPSYRGRVMYTTDLGQSWTVLPGPDARVSDLALDASGTYLAVAGDAGLRVTGDLGATWTELAVSWSGLRDMDWIGSDLYLATNQGLLVIRDATGPALAEPEVVYQPGVLGWAGRVAGDERTLLVTSYPFPQLFASTDGGETFELILGRTGISIEALELVGDDIYALQPGMLSVGRDRGAVWEQWGDPMPPAVEFDLSVWSGNPGAVYIASSGAGLYALDSSGEADRVGIPASQVLALASAVGPDGPTLIAGTPRDTFATTPPAHREAILAEDLEWRTNGGEGTSGSSARFLATSPADPSVVYKVRTDPVLTFGIWRSDDGGASWRRLASPSEFAHALLVHPGDPDRVFVSFQSLTSAGLVATYDGGATWEKLDHGRIFQALAGDPTDPDRIWAGDHEGLYLSEDGGLTFDRIAGLPVTAIAVDPADPDRLVIGGRGLFVSHDGGQTVQPADHVDLDMWVSDLEFAPDGERVFAATTAFYDELGVLRNGRGVLASVDGGESWESLDHGLRNRDTTSLAFGADGRHLYVGTLGGSVHRIKLT
ncbi:MAG TPA: S8 family serine peptidase [Natronosporangium sp.]